MTDTVKLHRAIVQQRAEIAADEWWISEYQAGRLAAFTEIQKWLESGTYDTKEKND